MILKGKKILFLTANFFNYEVEIIKRLKEFGAEVDFFNERPSDSVFTKGIIRVNSSLYQSKIDNYYKKILHEIQLKKFDFFLLIKGETMPNFFLEEFTKNNPQATKIFYTYDSAVEYPKFLKLYPYFDKVFTFEPEDAKKYNLHFRPLFYLKEYRSLQSNSKPQYDISFIGTAHTDRYLIGEKVAEISEKQKLSSFYYYYAPGKLAFLLKKVFDKNLKEFDLKKLSFQKLSHQNIIEIYKNSFAVLDINKPFQKGLTMRTFEVLAASKKLITTNTDVRKYPFFNSNNVQILNRENLDLDEEFFTTEFQKIPEKDLEMMSLDSWIECLFIREQDEYWGIKNNF